MWVSNIGSPGGLLKMADQGDSFQKVLDLAGQSGPDALGCVWLSWVNPVTDEVFANDGWAEQQKGLMARYDGKTGKRLPCAFTACDMAFDLDGNVLLQRHGLLDNARHAADPRAGAAAFPGRQGQQDHRPRRLRQVRPRSLPEGPLRLPRRHAVCLPHEDLVGVHRRARLGAGRQGHRGIPHRQLP